MCKVGPKGHCHPLFKKLKILTVINLYISLIHVKNNIEFYTRDCIHQHDTRSKTKIDIPRHRLKGKNKIKNRKLP